MMRKAFQFGSAAALMLMLEACGGAGGGIASLPPPTPTPTPPPAPTPQGAWYDTSKSTDFTSVATDVEDKVGVDNNVTSTISPDGADDVQIAYSAEQGSYVVTLPGVGQGHLSGNELLDSSGNSLAFVSLGAKESGFTYVDIGEWGVGDKPDARLGVFAFGTPTAAGDVPLSGTGNYSGRIAAQTDEAYVREPSGDLFPMVVSGTVTLSFDFAAGTLSGEIAPILSCENCFESYLPNMPFTQTVYSAGSTSYSGKFDTPLAGPNGFNGVFAGPHAAETMAQFQAPYIDPYYWTDLHVRSGVWIAKQP